MQLPGKIAVTVLLLCSVVIAGCSEQNDRETQLMDTLSAMEAAMENRDISTFMDYVSDDYQDSANRGIEDVRRLAQVHALRNRNLHIFRTIGQLSVGEANADAVIFVAVAGQPIESAASLANMRAELLRFEVQFAWDEDWQVTSAQWKRAGLNSFL